MSVLQITEVANPHNGVSVDIQLDRAPTGDLSLLVSRTPREAGQPATLQALPQDYRYRVLHPFPAVRNTEPELMYFTARDGEGDSVWEDDDGYLHGQVAAWIGTTAEDALTDVMKQLWRRIMDNRAGIEARLRMIEPEITLKQVIWGMGEKIETYPSMEINQASLAEPYMGAPRFRIASVRADIYGYIVHQTPTVEAELVTAFGRAVQRILNQEAYEQMELISGEVLAMCQAQDLSFDNNVWDRQRWVSSFALTWTGDFGETIE